MVKKNTEYVSTPPGELKSIFKKINVLPNDFEALRSIADEIKKVYLQYEEERKETFERRRNQSNYIAKLQVIFDTDNLNFLDKTIERNGFTNVYKEIKRLVNEKRLVLDIIYAYTMWSTSFNRAPKDFNFSTPISAFSFNDDTSIKLTSFTILKILEANSLPIERIKICKICGDVFWVKRIDSKACSDKCRNRYNTRKSDSRKRRKKIKEAIKENNAKTERLNEIEKSYDSNLWSKRSQLEFDRLAKNNDKLMKKLLQEIKKYEQLADVVIDKSEFDDLKIIEEEKRKNGNL